MRLAGHCDMATTMRHIHPEDETTGQAMQRARTEVDRRAQDAVERARRALEQCEGEDEIGDSAGSGAVATGPKTSIN
jgi:hypothetical protein